MVFPPQVARFYALGKLPEKGVGPTQTVQQAARQVVTEAVIAMTQLPRMIINTGTRARPASEASNPAPAQVAVAPVATVNPPRL